MWNISKYGIIINNYEIILIENDALYHRKTTNTLVNVFHLLKIVLDITFPRYNLEFFQLSVFWVTLYVEQKTELTIWCKTFVSVGTRILENRFSSKIGDMFIYVFLDIPT